MPETRVYEVTQTRTIKVFANTMIDAGLIAEKEFATTIDNNAAGDEPYPKPRWGQPHHEGVKDLSIEVVRIS